MISQGWAVVFLFRTGSLQPFARHLRPSSLLCALREDAASSSLLLPPGQEHSRLLPVVRAAREAEGKLLQIEFSSLSSYLWLLRFLLLVEILSLDLLPLSGLLPWPWQSGEKIAAQMKRL